MKMLTSTALVAALCCAAGANAQVAGDLPDPTIGPPVRTDTNGTIFAANETSACTTDFDPSRIITTWNDWREGGGGPNIVRMGVGVSFDGGQTWDDFLLRPPPANRTAVEGDPMTAFDNRDGTMWVGAISFAGNGGLYVARLDPGQTQFNAPVMARQTGAADKGWMAAGPDPSDPDNPDLVKLYIAERNGLIVSDDGGDTWAPQRSLGAGLGFLPRVGPNGELYVLSWVFNTTRIEIQRSFDGGDTILPRRLVANRLDIWGVDGSRFPGSFRVPPLATMAVDPNSGVIYVTYFDTRAVVDGNSNVEIYFTKSADQGDTWTTPTVVNRDDLFAPGDQFFPWIEVDRNGRIHMLFYDTRGFPDDDANSVDVTPYYQWSDDGGDTWTEAVLDVPFDSELDGRNTFSSFIGDYLGMAVGGETVFPCYLSNKNGNSDIFVNDITYELAGEDCPADWDGNGVVNAADVGAFLTTYFDDLENDTGEGDFNGDGVTNAADVGAFLTEYFETLGACP